MPKKKGTNLNMPKTRIQVRGIVRDKHGIIKIDDPKRIPEFFDILTDEDKLNLEKQYGEGILTRNDSA